MSTAATLPVPPLELMRLLSGAESEDDFFGVVQQFRPLFLRPGGLRPTDRVLDVGSGVGRMVHALADYIAPPGGYDGLEVAADGVRWCGEHLTPRLPHFRFHHADVYSQYYNPAGRQRSRVFRFPFADATFDFALLTSVFTHLLPKDAAHYLDEVSRVLKPGGRVFATFLLMNAERARIVRGGDCRFRFPYRHGRPPRPGDHPPAYGECFLESVEQPELAIGYEERWVGDQFRGCGLTPDAETYYGVWDGRPSAYNGQDIICATKTGSPGIGRRLKKAVRMDWLREWRWRRARG